MLTPKRNSREHGLLQERRIIDALRREPLDDGTLAKRFGVTRSNIAIYIKRMRDQKRIRVVGFMRPPEARQNCRPRPLFGLGSAPDVEYVPTRVNKPRQPDRGTTRRTLILAVLAESHTLAELCEKVNLSASPAREYVRQLREEKLVRICGWTQTGARNGWAPRYRIGSARDRAQPKAMTVEQINQRRRENTEQREVEKLRRQQREQLAKITRRPNGIFGALGV